MPRVLRGGSWNNDETNLRADVRNRNEPGNSNNNIGFRVARDVEPDHANDLVAGAVAITVAAGERFHFRIAIPTLTNCLSASNIQLAPVLW